MRNFQDTFETLKQSFISAFLICMTVPLINLFFSRLCFSMLVKPFLLKKHNVYVTIAPQHSIMKSSLPSVIFSFPTKVLSFGNFGSPELLRRSSLICLLRATIVTCCVFTLCIYFVYLSKTRGEHFNLMPMPCLSSEGFNTFLLFVACGALRLLLWVGSKALEEWLAS